MTDDMHVVSVEILGLRYPIRSTLDAGYVTELAAYVDAKMQAATAEGDPGDSVKIAVLAALNIADELFRLRAGDSPPARERDEMRARLEAIETTVDRVLAQAAQAAQTTQTTATLAPPAGSD